MDFLYRNSRRAVLILLSVAAPGSAYAQPDSTGVLTPPHATADDMVEVGSIVITGNRITRPNIIMRELVFHQGDLLPYHVLAEAVRRSRENLLNTSLFNFVEILEQPDAGNPGLLHLIVQVAERWYLWPLPVFELVDRNFNEWWLTRDFSRTNYGAYVTRENFRGRKEKLSLLVRLGYSQRFGLFYTIPYINKRQVTGLAFGATYTRNHEIAFGLRNSKLAYYRDDRQHVRKQVAAGASITHRQGIHDYHTASVQFQDSEIADTILNFNPDYFIKNTTEQQLLIVTYQYKNDRRDLKTYPLKGHYFDLEVFKIGIGTLKNEPSLLALTSNLRKYWRLTPRWHVAAGVKGKLSGRTPAPYYNQQGLGYGNSFVRGYEYYVISAQNYVLGKSTLKYTLLPEKVITTRLVPHEKFSRIPFAIYANLFYDAGYARDVQFAETSPLSNSYLHGVGAGIDYVTYYDIVFRVEYTWNRELEHGVYLHFTAPIF